MYSVEVSLLSKTVTRIGLELLTWYWSASCLWIDPRYGPSFGFLSDLSQQMFIKFLDRFLWL
jgi:hypothetical protein